MKNTIRNTQYAILITLILACLILPQTAQAAEYYLDAVNGNDANPGTSEQPWRTMVRAMQNYSGSPRVTLGDTVILRDGNYGTAVFGYSYSASVPQPTSWDDKITYKAEVGHTPVLEHLEIIGNYNRYLEFDGIDVTVTVPHPMQTDAYHAVYVTSKSLRFRNMKITGYWTNRVRAGLTESGIGFQVQPHDFLVENCDIGWVNSGIKFGVGAPITAPIIIRNNNIHDIAGHGISMNAHSGEKIIIENNYIHDAHLVLDWQAFTCSEPIAGDQSLWDQWHANKEKLVQDVTGAEGIFGKFHTDATHVMVYITKEVDWELGYTIRGVDIPLVFEPVALYRQDWSHQTAIALRADNAEIRNNILHAFSGNGCVHTFPGETYEPLVSTGYCNLLIENNLFYDPSPTTGIPLLHLRDLGTNVTIRNNTIVGCRGPDYPTGSRNGYYYRVPARLWLKPGKDGSGIKFHNNIIVGALDIETNMTEWEEDYNLIYSVLQGGWKSSLKGTHTIVYSNGSNELKIFDTDFFVDPDYSRGTDFETYPSDGGPHGRVCNYRLKEGAPAINFGDPVHAPETDLDGNLRDVTPDAGAYEYGASAFLFGDVNEDGEIGAFDAALAAHIAVNLEHPDVKNRAAAEVSGDGEVGAYDAALIAQYAVGLISKFPVEE